MPRKQHRFFCDGDHVRISKKSVVVDRERSQENLAPEDRIPIEQNVTGYDGKVIAPSYPSTEKGDFCVPIRLRNGAVISVPEKRLENVSAPAKIGYSRSFAAGWDKAFKKRNRRKRK